MQRAFKMIDLMSIQYKECKACSEKPGSPALCEACFHNRSIVNQPKTELEFYRLIIEKLTR